MRPEMSVLDKNTQDEDKWRLRERIIANMDPELRWKPLDSDTPPVDTARSERFEGLFRPTPPAPIERSLFQVMWSKIDHFISRPPRGVNDNGQSSRSPFMRWFLEFGRTCVAYALNKIAALVRPTEQFTPILIAYLKPRVKDAISIPAAVLFFVLPLVILTVVDPAPSATKEAILLIGSTFAASVLFGPRFGTIASTSAFAWLAWTMGRPTETTPLIDALTHWSILVVMGAMIAVASAGLGTVSKIFREIFALGRKNARRQKDMAEFQNRLLRANHTDAVLSYIVAYCRDVLKRRAIFLALDENKDHPEPEENYDIGAQLKSIGYARVVVDRKSYLPRALKSFSTSGFKPFPLETPSGTIGLLGIDKSDGKSLPLNDERDIKILLSSAAYALERILLLEKMARIEELRVDEKAKSSAILSIVGNLTQTTVNLDDQAYGLHQLLDREPNRPYDAALNLIRRNISSLRNSIMLLRDVTSPSEKR